MTYSTLSFSQNNTMVNLQRKTYMHVVPKQYVFRTFQKFLGNPTGSGR